MWNIFVRRATENDYGLLSIRGIVLEFNTKEEALQFGRENIEGKSMWIVSWYVAPKN
jgi:hypothetical protein